MTYIPRNRKRQLLKLLLCLSIISPVVFLSWIAYHFFQYKENPLWGTNLIWYTVTIVSSLAILVKSAKLIRSYHYRRVSPNFKLVSISLLAIVITLAFAGVEPLYSYKDKLINTIEDRMNSSESTNPLRLTIIAYNHQHLDSYAFTINVKDNDRTVYDTPYTIKIIVQGKVQDSVEITWPNPAQFTEREWILIEQYKQNTTLHANCANLREATLREYNSAKKKFDEIDEEAWYHVGVEFANPGTYSYDKLKELQREWDEARADLDKWEDWKNGKEGNTAQEIEEIDSFCKRYIQLTATQESDGYTIQQTDREIVTQQSIAEQEQEVHNLINEERTKRGLSSLLWSNQLYSQASNHSDKMALQNNLFHSSYNSLPGNGGECVWYGSGQSWRPEDIVNSWMESPEHRELLLTAQVRGTAGTGISCSNNATYATWIFSRQSSEPPRLQPSNEQTDEPPRLQPSNGQTDEPPRLQPSNGQPSPPKLQ